MQESWRKSKFELPNFDQEIFDICTPTKFFDQMSFIGNEFVWLAALTSVVLSIYNSYTVDFQPQGRYIIYMILPISLAITRGFESMSAILLRRSKEIRAMWPYVFCGLYVAVNYFVFFRYII